MDLKNVLMEASKEAIVLALRSIPFGGDAETAIKAVAKVISNK